MSLVVAVVTVYFRDFYYLLGVFLQLIYFATPILYPLGAMPAKYQFVLKLNPLYPQINLFQKLIYAGVLPSIEDWLTALAVALASFVVGWGLLLLREEDLVFRL
jgi:ABC-2 type transport system permease protein/lipopolysaccharide transport system permease protein